MSPLIKKILSYSLVRFGIVGIINTVIDFCIFFLLYSLFDWSVIPANIFAFLVAVTNSYFMNKYWSFAHRNSTDRSFGEFSKFVIISILTVTLSTSILVFGEPYLAVLYLKIIAAIITPAVNFIAYRMLVFR